MGATELNKHVGAPLASQTRKSTDSFNYALAKRFLQFREDRISEGNAHTILF